MPFFELMMKAVYLFTGLVGLGLVVSGAWGSLWLPRQRAGTPLTAQQRVLCTVLGLVLIAAAWALLTGRLPQGQ
jgi:hypothetical protein